MNFCSLSFCWLLSLGGFWLAVGVNRSDAGEPVPSGFLSRDFIFTEPPTPQCHAATIVETSAGTLLCAWFGGTREGAADVGIWLSRFQDGAWSRPVEVATSEQVGDNRFPCWNPVLFQVPKGPLLLFYKVGPNPRGWWGLVRESRDDGKSWSEAKRLPEGIYGPIKNKPVVLPGGVLLSPSSTEDRGWRVHFERSEDSGKTWVSTGPINDGKTIAAIQPSVLIRRDGSLLAIGRSRQGKLWQAVSADSGKTWSEMTLTELPNPNSGTDAVTLADGRHLLVYNHTQKGRTPLNLAISTDDGKTWQAAGVLEAEPGEYSYPAVIQRKDGRVQVVYTWKRQRIRTAIFDVNQLRLKALSPDIRP
jgi:predicted neuraminidase